MSYPILEFDPSRRAMIEPAALHAPSAVPEAAVLCFFADVIEKLSSEGRARECARWRGEEGAQVVYDLELDGDHVALLHPGVGAALAAIRLENAIALGCRRFVACGGAGALVPELALGHVVVPTSAVRDEGTSYHYLPPDREVAADPEAVRLVEALLNERGVPCLLGKTWTTDGPYRETPARVSRRREEGCLVVEMEAAALLAVAQFRQVPLVSLLYAGDSLAGDEWDHRSWDRHGGREPLLRLAAEAALRL
ncbi:MAG TPA: nucleoside phosphorylase [Candidatus Dormibacteraeota bacterium]|nr:nucleoside phosphorylase [Candidatus Dormibacteraeota bacterium]